VTVYERVVQVLKDGMVEEKNWDKITPEASLVDDLEADSLDLVELSMAMEEEFIKNGQEVEITDEESEKAITVQDVVDLLKRKGMKDDLD